MKKKTFVVVILLVAFVASCNRTETISEKKSFRKEFIGEKGIGVVREDFKNASFDVKQKLWIDKLEYLLNQDFDNEIRADIRVIKDFISDFGNEDKYLAFNQATIRLANNIPKEDFMLMFTSLDDYDYSGSFLGKEKVSKVFIDYIEGLKETYYLGENLNGSSIPSVARRKCSCRWCLFVPEEYVTANCDEADFGCGFLWLQSCNRTVFI
ncbi:exported hypothetical protein [Capnocytophaga canimorsus]|nr:bacteriocin fulvocin C-related protein [Capnocytophaga canimorsus]CEN47610.1 exported hypothetical protein [Capnocytophaga canimorsus]